MAKILKRKTEKVKSSDSIRVRLSNVESSITNINNNTNITDETMLALLYNNSITEEE